MTDLRRNVSEAMAYARNLLDLDGRVALITGAGSGLGTAWAAGLAAHGAYVAVADIDLTTARAVSEAINDEGGRAQAIQLDVTDVSGAGRAVDQLMQETDRIDVLINSAGAAYRSPAEDFPVDAFDRILALNLRGSYTMCQLVARHMLPRRSGSIINIASIGGLVAYPQSSAYIASKGGVVQFTKALAIEWVDRGVRVNAIAPGLAETPMVSGLDQSTSVTTDFIRTRMLNERLLQPPELIGAALFLASEASRRVTGQVIAVDDGYLAA